MKQRTLAVGLVLATATGALLLSLRDDPGPSLEPAPQGSAMAGHSAPRPSRKQLPPAGPSEAALLAPLVVGGELAEWEVEFIGAVNEGRLPVVIAKDGARLRLEIVLASSDAPPPAAATRRFHVYYRPSTVPPLEASRLATELARVLAKNGEVPAPEGMRAYEEGTYDLWSEGI